MPLTPEQEAEAKRLYIESKLSALEADIARSIEHNSKIIREAHEAIREARERCPHPPITPQKTYSASRDEYGRCDYTEGGTYRFHCELCGARWTQSDG